MNKHATTKWKDVNTRKNRKEKRRFEKACVMHCLGFRDVAFITGRQSVLNGDIFFTVSSLFSLPFMFQCSPEYRIGVKTTLNKMLHANHKERSSLECCELCDPWLTLYLATIINVTPTCCRT